ncbi:HAD family hydrolase [Nocardioides euryhalodurans]|uniref:HAD family hydrolase n=1 Tax=Nocardioides euryhalodurans TaxID=2518370 RepID=A0A4V1BDT0_9ACTN|nr:HAD-IA family hydrolase [Nocardioides euryhalodurans]QBR92192.1 HAD family hydrolase [Nocardioides euryhalodurans]
MVRHLLLDADGVLQRVGGNGWRAKVDAALGEHADAFVADLRDLEGPALVGSGDFPAALGRALAEYAPDVDPERFYAGTWLDLETVEETVAVVEDVRRAGAGVHLVSNQHPRRADHMRDVLGYDRLLDRSFYSCDLGVAKPDPAFFARVVSELGSDAGELLVVDDSAANVAGARHAGLPAEQWHHDEGVDVLRARLTGHGLLG